VKRALGLGLIVGLVGLSLCAVDVDLDYVDDITALSEQCFIRAIKLDLAEEGDGETADERVYQGTLELAEGRHLVRLAIESEEARLWVDRDGTGELVRAEWERFLADGSLLADVALTLTYADASRAPYQLFLMWNPFFPTVVTFCRNSYREGTVAFVDRAVRVAVIDADTDGRYDVLDGGVLLVDTDGDGELLATGDSHERFLLDEPFHVDGASFAVAAVDPGGGSMRIEATDEPVAPKAPLLPGFVAPDFAGVDLDGREITLASLRGRVVVLDFWAAWCSPCVAELPTLRTIVTRFDETVTVLGINLDRSADAFEDALSDHAIDWPQVYDGSDGPIGDLYRIDGIPMTYLVDRDGRIVARGLRGGALVVAVAELADGDADAELVEGDAGAELVDGDGGEEGEGG